MISDIDINLVMLEDGQALACRRHLCWGQGLIAMKMGRDSTQKAAWLT